MGKTLPTVAVLLALEVLTMNAAEAQVWLHPTCRPLPCAVGGPFVTMDDGTILTVEGNATRTSADGGRTWSDPRPMYDGPGPGVPRTSPCLLRTRGGALVLVYMDLEGYYFRWDQATDKLEAELDVWAIRSLDGGHTWTDRQRLLDGYCGSLQNIIQTRSGRIVVAVQDALRDPVRHAQYVYSSADEGKTWRRSNLLDLGGRGDHDGAMEPTVAELTDGRLLLLIRTTLDRFWEAYSVDDGLYWRELRPSGIDASSSPGYLLRLASGRLALVWNRLYPEGLEATARAQYPRAGGGQLSEAMASWQRDELALAFSEDDARTWSQPVVIARLQDGNLAYPYVFEARPGELLITAGPARLVAPEAKLLGP